MIIPSVNASIRMELRRSASNARAIIDREAMSQPIKGTGQKEGERDLQEASVR